MSQRETGGDTKPLSMPRHTCSYSSNRKKRGSQDSDRGRTPDEGLSNTAMAEGVFHRAPRFVGIEAIRAGIGPSISRQRPTHKNELLDTRWEDENVRPPRVLTSKLVTRTLVLECLERHPR